MFRLVQSLALLSAFPPLSHADYYIDDTNATISYSGLANDSWTARNVMSSVDVLLPNNTYLPVNVSACYNYT